ncbi:unnamed protein product [Gongylonema pulchrum]|uniref:Secreted protein n=1 Tax=Gongylonema pulchrum TaxID=637853 RepID=A0A183DA38_9BILA|nr:unnamed protein product [Gongylonema pulchrum]
MVYSEEMLFGLLIFSVLVLRGVFSEIAQELPNPCADAPSESARIICEQLHKWDRQARAKPPVGSLAALPPAIPGKMRLVAAELAPITASPYQCMDLECLCTYLKGQLFGFSIS